MALRRRQTKAMWRRINGEDETDTADDDSGDDGLAELQTNADAMAELREVHATMASEIDGLAAVQLTERRAAAELEMLKEATRRYETVERARVSEILEGVRSQGRGLRDAMALHTKAAEGSRLQTPAAKLLRESVSRGSAAVVRRAINHVTMCATVAARASKAVVDDAGALVLANGSRRELRRATQATLAWFARAACDVSYGALSRALLDAALTLRRKRTDPLLLRPSKLSVVIDATLRDIDNNEYLLADLAYRATNWLRLSHINDPVETLDARHEACAHAAAAAARGLATTRRTKWEVTLGAAHYELVLALARASGVPRKSTVASALLEVYALATPQPFAAPGIPDAALGRVFAVLAGNGDAAAYSRLASVCRQFRDASRANGPAALAEAPGGVLLRDCRRGEAVSDEACARDASLAATLRWIARGKPRKLSLVGRTPSRSCARPLGAVFGIGFPRLRSVVSLTIDGVRGFDDGACTAVAAGLDRLEEVCLVGTKVGDAGLAALAAGLRETLTKVRLDSANLPDSKDLIGDVGVSALSRVCGRSLEERILHTVSVERYARIGDEAVLALAGGLGATLKHLSLAGCEGLSDLAPVALADACRALRCLNLNGCTRVSDVGALALSRHPELRRLSLQGTRVCAVGIDSILDHSPKLRVLRDEDSDYKFLQGSELASPSVLRDVCERRGESEAPLHRVRVLTVDFDGDEDSFHLVCLCGGTYANAFGGSRRRISGGIVVGIDDLDAGGHALDLDRTTLERASMIPSKELALSTIDQAGTATKVHLACSTVLQAAFGLLLDAVEVADERDNYCHSMCRPGAGARCLASREFIGFLLDALVRTSRPSSLRLRAGLDYGFRGSLLWDAASAPRLEKLLKRAVDTVAAADPNRRRLLKTIRHAAALRMVERAQTAGGSHASNELVRELAEMIH